jgi:hypothetical protein
MDVDDVPMIEVFVAKNGYLIVDELGETYVALELEDITKAISIIIEKKKRKELLIPDEYIDDPLVDEG